MAMEHDDTQFVREHLSSIYTFVYRLCGSSEDANDITQEVFIKAWKNLSKLDKDKPIKPWLFRIARNTTIDWLRKKKNVTFSELDYRSNNLSVGEGTPQSFESTVADETPLADTAYEHNELAQVLQRALNKISIEQRTIVLLHDTEELTFEEIALVVDIPMNTVKSHYRRAILSLRKHLKHDPTAPKNQ